MENFKTFQNHQRDQPISLRLSCHNDLRKKVCSVLR